MLKLMRKHGISTTTSSPPFYDRLADFHEANPDVPAHNLRRILVGGAPVSQAQLRRWGKSGPTRLSWLAATISREPVAHIAALERLEQEQTQTRSAGHLPREDRTRRQVHGNRDCRWYYPRDKGL